MFLVLENADFQIKAPHVLNGAGRVQIYVQQCLEFSATGMGQFPICKLKWDLLRTSITACTIDENTFSVPFGIFYVRREIWKEIFQKKSYTTP